MNEADYREFESELGNVAVTDSHVERDPNENDWEAVEEEYDQEPLVEPVHFSDIERLDCFLGDEHPSVLVKTSEGWKCIPFLAKGAAENCYKHLRHRWQSYRQLHG